MPVDIDNNAPDVPRYFPSKRKPGTSQASQVRHNTKFMMRAMRDLRFKRYPPYLIIREMGITRQQYDRVINLIETEDAELLELESKKRLQSEISRYVETADVVIAANLDIIQDHTIAPSDRQESSKIALDAAMTVVKIHTEGPRILKEVYEPVSEFIRRFDKRLPLPPDQQYREQEMMDKYAPPYMLATHRNQNITNEENAAASGVSVNYDSDQPEEQQ